jgi:hypothetical protein
MKRLTTLAALASFAFASVPADASSASRNRLVRCVIASAGAPTWRGPCWFTPEGRDGSFSVAPQRGDFADGIGSISLMVNRPGVGEVRGLTAQGINSNWGTARRSPRDRACWIGEDFSVCVY